MRTFRFFVDLNIRARCAAIEGGDNPDDLPPLEVSADEYLMLRTCDFRCEGGTVAEELTCKLLKPFMGQKLKLKDAAKLIER